MAYQFITYAIESGAAIIRFNRPEKRNALNPEMMEEIGTALIDAEADQQVRAVILTGDAKSFISGTDIDFLVGDGEAISPQRMYTLHESTQTMYRRLSGFSKPTIAAVAGFALGGGLELALCCDFRIAAENTKFGTPEIKLGILPGAGGTQRLMRIIGVTLAKEMVLTGALITASEAYQWGLLNKIVPVEELMTAAMAMAARFNNLPGFAVSMAKSVMDTGSNMSLKEALEVERLGFSILYSTHDQKEGLRAFLEKRQPRFQHK